MDPAIALAYVVHFGFAALWTGSVLFFAYALLPAASAGDASAAPLALATSRLVLVSRTSAILQLLSGGYLASRLYTSSSFTNTGDGQLVLAMILLWILLAATVEMGARRFDDALGEDSVSAAASTARSFFLAASLFAALLLVDAGLLAA